MHECALFSNKYGTWEHHIWCHFVRRTLQGYFWWTRNPRQYRQASI